MDKTGVIAGICEAIANGKIQDAATCARTEYPFTAVSPQKRRYSESEKIRAFAEDGFIDRYSGQRLVFPGTLRLLSALLPDEFPAHPNWLMSKSHIVFWELFPTIDHVEPVARGGPDHWKNRVTTSMMRNSAKGNWTLEELGWRLLDGGSLDEWDGLTQWAIEQVKRGSPLGAHRAYIERWVRAAGRVAKERNILRWSGPAC